jgi:hypothetical protein
VGILFGVGLAILIWLALEANKKAEEAKEAAEEAAKAAEEARIKAEEEAAKKYIEEYQTHIVNSVSTTRDYICPASKFGLIYSIANPSPEHMQGNSIELYAESETGSTAIIQGATAVSDHEFTDAAGTTPSPSAVVHPVIGEQVFGYGPGYYRLWVSTKPTYSPVVAGGAPESRPEWDFARVFALCSSAPCAAGGHLARGWLVAVNATPPQPASLETQTIFLSPKRLSGGYYPWEPVQQLLRWNLAIRWIQITSVSRVLEANPQSDSLEPGGSQPTVYGPITDASGVQADFPREVTINIRYMDPPGPDYTTPNTVEKDGRIFFVDHATIAGLAPPFDPAKDIQAPIMPYGLPVDGTIQITADRSARDANVFPGEPDSAYIVEANFILGCLPGDLINFPGGGVGGSGLGEAGVGVGVGIGAIGEAGVVIG